MGKKYHKKKSYRGLSKYGKKHSRKQNYHKHAKYLKKKKNRETKFVTLNATNVGIIKTYFNTIAYDLFEKLANTRKFVLYQFEGSSRDIFLVPTIMSRLVKNFSRDLPIHHAGIHLGYMKPKRTRTGFRRAFYLSYEGGEFLVNFVQNEFPELFPNLYKIRINEDGEKAFLYGSSIGLEYVLTDTSKLEKNKIIFVFDVDKIYIGLALLRVRQAGSINRPDEDGNKPVDKFSRSDNFALNIMNLTDSGYYLRKGG